MFGFEKVLADPSTRKLRLLFTSNTHFLLQFSCYFTLYILFWGLFYYFVKHAIAHMWRSEVTRMSRSSLSPHGSQRLSSGHVV